MKNSRIYLGWVIFCLAFSTANFSSVNAANFGYEEGDMTVDEWIKKAEKCLLSGQEKEASRCYEQALLSDPENLSANIFLGNYYYIQGEVARKDLEAKFNEQNKPNQAEREEYFNALSDLWPTYDKAKEYLEKVLSSFPSSEVKSTLEHIEELHETIQ